MKQKIVILVTILILTLVSSCGEYQKMLKSTDVRQKYEYAEQLYKKGDYKRSARIFEDVVPSYLGKPQGERVLYMYADALYRQGLYMLAGYQFEKFTVRYPNSQRAEEAFFFRGKSLYHQIPYTYSVDQTETQNALEVLQTFVDRYPNSSHMEEANELIMSLVKRLQQKSFEIAKNYYTIRDYQAAVKAIDNFIADNPGTEFKEDAFWVKLQASYQLADNSVEYKKQARLKAAQEAYQALIKSFPNTKYRKKADAILAQIQKNLK